mgnify:FL=1
MRPLCGIIHSDFNHERVVQIPMEADSSSDERRQTNKTLNNDFLHHMRFCVCWIDQLRL